MKPDIRCEGGVLQLSQVKEAEANEVPTDMEPEVPYPRKDVQKDNVQIPSYEYDQQLVATTRGKYSLKAARMLQRLMQKLEESFEEFALLHQSGQTKQGETFAQYLQSLFNEMRNKLEDLRDVTCCGDCDSLEHLEMVKMLSHITDNTSEISRQISTYTDLSLLLGELESKGRSSTHLRELVHQKFTPDLLYSLLEGKYMMAYISTALLHCFIRDADLTNDTSSDQTSGMEHTDIFNPPLSHHKEKKVDDIPDRQDVSRDQYEYQYDWHGQDIQNSYLSKTACDKESTKEVMIVKKARAHCDPTAFFEFLLNSLLEEHEGTGILEDALFVDKGRDLQQLKSSSMAASGKMSSQICDTQQKQVSSAPLATPDGPVSNTLQPGKAQHSLQAISSVNNMTARVLHSTDSMGPISVDKKPAQLELHVQPPNVSSTSEGTQALAKGVYASIGPASTDIEHPLAIPIPGELEQCSSNGLPHPQAKQPDIALQDTSIDGYKQDENAEGGSSPSADTQNNVSAHPSSPATSREPKKLSELNLQTDIGLPNSTAIDESVIKQQTIQLDAAIDPIQGTTLQSDGHRGDEVAQGPSLSITSKEPSKSTSPHSGADPQYSSDTTESTLPTSQLDTDGRDNSTTRTSSNASVQREESIGDLPAISESVNEQQPIQPDAAIDPIQGTTQQDPSSWQSDGHEVTQGPSLSATNNPSPHSGTSPQYTPQSTLNNLLPCFQPDSDADGQDNSTTSNVIQSEDPSEFGNTNPQSSIQSSPAINESINRLQPIQLYTASHPNQDDSTTETSSNDSSDTETASSTPIATERLPPECWSVFVNDHPFESLLHFVENAECEVLTSHDKKSHATVCHALAGRCNLASCEVELLLRQLKAKGHESLFVEQNESGNTPMHIAVERRDPILIEVLLKCSTECLQVRNSHDDNPCQLAFNTKQWRILELFLHELVKAAEIQANNPVLLMDLLHRAMEKGDTQFLSILLALQQQHNIEIGWNHVKNKATPWKLLLDQPNDTVIEALRILSYYGVSLDELLVDVELGDTMLHRVARRGCRPLYQILVTHGANEDQRNSKKETPKELFFSDQKHLYPTAEIDDTAPESTHSSFSNNSEKSASFTSDEGTIPPQQFASERSEPSNLPPSATDKANPRSPGTHRKQRRKQLSKETNQSVSFSSRQEVSPPSDQPKRKKYTKEACPDSLSGEHESEGGVSSTSNAGRKGPQSLQKKLRRLAAEQRIERKRRNTDSESCSDICQRTGSSPEDSDIPPCPPPSESEDAHEDNSISHFSTVLQIIERGNQSKCMAKCSLPITPSATINFLHLRAINISSPLNEENVNALHIALEIIDLPTLQFLIRRCDIANLINQCNRDGHSPLYKALYRQEPQMLKLLLDELVRSGGYCELRSAFPAKWLTLPIESHMGISYPFFILVKTISDCRRCSEDAATEELCIIYKNQEELAYIHQLSFTNKFPRAPECSHSSDGSRGKPKFIVKNNSSADKKKTPNSSPDTGFHSFTESGGLESNDYYTAQEATDDGSRYSVLIYTHTNGSWEVIKKHFQSRNVRCCLKHEMQAVLVGNSFLRGSSDSHSDFSTPSSSNKDKAPVIPDRRTVVADCPMPSLAGATPTVRHQQSSLSPSSSLNSNRDSSVIPDRRTVVPDCPVLPLAEATPTVRYQQPSLTPKPSLSSTGSVGMGDQSVSSSLKNVLHSSHELVKTCREQIRRAADLLHAQDYSRIPETLSSGNPQNLPADALVRGQHHDGITVTRTGDPPHPDVLAELAVAYKFGCALAYYKLSKHKEATAFFQECEKLAAEAHRNGDVFLSSVYMGDINFSKQSYDVAARHYAKAIQFYSTENVAQLYKMIVPTISGLYTKRASALRNGSRAVDAVHAYKKAIATAESKKDKLSAHTSLGNLYQSLGENTSALSEYEQSISLSKELEDHISLGWAHGNMGNAYLGLYQREKALHHLEKSLKLALKHEPTPQAIGRAYNNLGTAYQALNELDKAEEYYDLSLSQGIYGNDLPGQARVYGNIGNLLMLRKNFDKAIPHYTEVLRLSRDKSTVSTAFHNRGCAYYEWGETKKKNLLQKAASKSPFHLYGSEFSDCEVEFRPPILPDSILKFYRQGSHDLTEVVKFHEQTLESIKGAPEGLSLSVSLFETNSRTFHRLQDCLVNNGDVEKALLVAEQSRARTLGELLLKRKGWQLNESFHSPLTLEQVMSIVKSQTCPVAYLSYTGARLLVWVLVPKPESVSLCMFEVPLEDDQFAGKSFDYHLRYNLTEVLVEQTMEMYKSFSYTSSDSNEPVRQLYRLIAKPLQMVLKALCSPEPESSTLSVVLIPDSYTNLLPFSCLQDPETGTFLGDHCNFRIMPSLLTMGILDQLRPIEVIIPAADVQSMCVVGNPTIPPFMYNGEQWNLGKLPHAAGEAKWVAHILKTTPILEEQATKRAVMTRIMSAKVIHIATHGSAAAGFLAFAGIGSSRQSDLVNPKDVLIYPEDIESLSITPALVVLSSCDSGRGTVKADGIIGMARAFLLAGAQAVLTTLWRVPDESAAVFMQFMYQYLLDGERSSEALQKAMLSLRCFSKYSQYIHWSGYQLTGRDVQFSIGKSVTEILRNRLGSSSVFPRLDVVKQLESAFIINPQAPTDVQILRGSPGMRPSEPLIDFVHSFHQHFKGGIFWLNGRNPELIKAGVAYIENAMARPFPGTSISEVNSALVILDNIEQLAELCNHKRVMKCLKNPNTHIVVISKHYPSPDSLRKEIDHQLLRGCKEIDIKPLSMIHTTQRIVHALLSKHHLTPGNEDQEIFEKLAQFTCGAPTAVNVTSHLLLSQMKPATDDEPKNPSTVLRTFSESLCLNELGPPRKPSSVVRREQHGVARLRETSRNVHVHKIQFDPTVAQDPWLTDAYYDSWQSVAKLIEQCKLLPEEQLLLYCLSMFSCSPIPMSLVTEISSIIVRASQQLHLGGTLHSRLSDLQLLKRYPLPIVFHSSLVTAEATDPVFVYAPQFISRAIWKDVMSPADKVAALGTTHKACSALQRIRSSKVQRLFMCGLSSLLLDTLTYNYDLMGTQCYQETYRSFLALAVDKPEITIFVHMLTGETITLFAMQSDTVASIKTMIQEKNDLKPAEQVLYFGEQQLEDRRTLRDCNVQVGDTVELELVVGNPTVTIIVHMPAGETVTIYSMDSDTIATVKFMIHEKCMIEKKSSPLPDKQELFIDGKQLEDKNTLRDCSFTVGDTFEIDLRVKLAQHTTKFDTCSLGEDSGVGTLTPLSSSDSENSKSSIDQSETSTVSVKADS